MSVLIFMTNVHSFVEDSFLIEQRVETLESSFFDSSIV